MHQMRVNVNLFREKKATEGYMTLFSNALWFVFYLHFNSEGYLRDHKNL